MSQTEMIQTEELNKKSSANAISDDSSKAYLCTLVLSCRSIHWFHSLSFFYSGIIFVKHFVGLSTFKVFGSLKILQFMLIRPVKILITYR